MPVNCNFTVPSLLDGSVASEKDQSAYCHQTDICHMDKDTSSRYFFIGILYFHQQIFQGSTQEGGRGHVEEGGKTKTTILKYLGLDDLHHRVDRERSKNTNTRSSKCSSG